MFFRKVSLLAFSAFSLSSVHTPRTLQPAEVVPVYPRHPICWWDEYEPEVLPLTPANASFALFNGSIVLAQGPLDTFPVLAQVHIRPAISFDLAGTDLAHTAPASLKLAGSHLASPNIAGFDLASLEEVEGVFTATMALARLVKRKTGVVWTKLLASFVVVAGLLAFDGILLGEPQYLVTLQSGIGFVTMAPLAMIRRRLLLGSSLLLQSPILPILLALFDTSLLDVAYALALDKSLASFLISTLPRPRHNILSPTSAKYTRKKKLFKGQRLKARLARQAVTRSWYNMFVEAFLLALPTVVALPFDVPWVDIVYGLFLSGTIVDLMARYIPGVWFVLRIIFPPPAYRASRAKERYKRRKKNKLA